MTNNVQGITFNRKFIFLFTEVSYLGETTGKSVLSVWRRLLLPIFGVKKHYFPITFLKRPYFYTKNDFSLSFSRKTKFPIRRNRNVLKFPIRRFYPRSFLLDGFPLRRNNYNKLRKM